MNENPVFFDREGRRGRVATRLSALLGFIFAILVTVVAIAVFLTLPFIPGVGGKTPTALRSTHPPLIGALADVRHQAGLLLSKRNAELNQEIDRARRERGRQPKAPRSGPVVGAFLSSDNATSMASLRKNASKLTHLMPEWLHLTPNGVGLDQTAFKDPSNRSLDVAKIADQNGIRVYPILNNYSGGENGTFDPKRVQDLLSSPQNERALIGSVTAWIESNRFEGLNLDLENLTDADYAKLPSFAKALSAALQRQGLGLSIDLEDSQIDLAPKLADACDFIVLMDYDQHWETSDSGPIAANDWFDNNLLKAAPLIPQDKLVIGIGNYGYDWTVGSKSPADDLTYQGAVMLAQENRDDLPPDQCIVFDPASLNSHFEYFDDSNARHEVWFLDGPSAYNEWRFATQTGVRGAAVWELGSEDPSIWNFLDRNHPGIPQASEALSKVTYPYEINFNGDGEILTVPPGFDTPKPGTRSITSGPDGICTNARYESYPSSVVVDRQGVAGNKLALTFDDGPSSEWTPKILDTLEQLKAPATFFVLGENAIEHPSLVRREYVDGDEIGSHSFTHPNMGEISDIRAGLELDATQRAIQSIIGRTTRLFRPPYNADSTPDTVEEIKPVALASKLNYYTIAEGVDPQDWSLQNPTRTGGVYNRTAQEMAQDIVYGVKHHDGNVILLHDAGGDRHLTVETLKFAVPRLRADGYKFVLVSDLFRPPLTRNDVMPQLSSRDLLLLPFEKAAVYFWYFLSVFLTLAFLACIGLGVSRILIVTPLALVAARKTVLPPFDAEHGPLVSVIIAAYNEEPVIVRTVQSVLGSLYHRIEVIVVDDGSKDGTFRVAQDAFTGEARVTVLHQENGGKASALNTGMAIAKGEIQVYLDADTLLASDAILKMVRHFADPKVGAVAGNVKVGNRVNALTRLQAVEYIASQNLDRRAYAYVNAITVVPGAIGAWRKSAVDDAGGYTSDTLAEDMDLTWRIRRKGWKIDNESEAVAYTEAPANVKSFFKQRFRWAFGTLQCLFKHKDMVGHYGWFGRAVLPGLWVFQIFMQIIAPFVDLNLVLSVGMFLGAWASHSALTKDWRPLPDAAQTMSTIGFLYAVFFLIELAGAWIAFRLDKEKKSLLWWLFLQRFFYRQIMYAVVWKALWNAIRGARTGWGKFERMGTVHGVGQRG